MSSSRNFLLRYAPDCTFSSRKIKKLPTVGGGTPPSPSHTLPPARSLRSLGLGRFAPSQRLCPPKCFGSLRHWCHACSNEREKTTTTPIHFNSTARQLPLHEKKQYELQYMVYALYTERQNKLITYYSERRSLEPAASTLIIFGHR